LHFIRQLREKLATMCPLGLVVTTREITRDGGKFDITGLLLTRLQLQHVLDITVEDRNHSCGRNSEERADEDKECTTICDRYQHNIWVQVHGRGLQPWRKHIAFELL